MTACSRPASECPWTHDSSESSCDEEADAMAEKFGVISVDEPIEPDDLTGETREQDPS